MAGKSLKRVSAFLLLAVLLGSAFFFLKRQEQVIYRKLELALVGLANHESLANSGLVIEDLTVKTDFFNLLTGQVHEIYIAGRIRDIPFRLRGPMKYAMWMWAEKHRIRYYPLIFIGSSDTPLSTDLNLVLNRQLDRVLALNLKLSTEKFILKEINLEATKADLNLALTEDFHAFLKIQSLNYEMTPENMFGLTEVKLKAHSPNLADIFTGLTLGNAEILWGESYYDIPFKDFLLNVDLKNQSQLSAQLKKSDKSFLFQVESNDLETYTLNANVSATKFLPWLASTLKNETLAQSKWKAGSLILTANTDKNLSSMDGRVQVLRLSADIPPLTFDNLQLSLPFSTANSSTGQLSLDKMSFRRLNAKIEKTAFKVKPVVLQTPSTNLEFRKLVVANNASDFIFENIKTGLGSDLTYQSSLVTKPESVNHILRTLCIDSSLPQNNLTINFSELNIQGNDLKTNGTVKLRALGGEAILNNLKIYRLFSEVPETQFDLHWQDMQLQEINNFVKFGKMEGEFEGHFKNVVFQAGLPTQFNFLFQVKPGRKGQVVFSSRAMKNFIQLFTPEDFSKYMTGPLNWFAFGWASDLLGGYNIDYAGLSLYSHQGSILLETLDPPKVVKETKKHFILNGPRVKVPIQSRQYPIVLDAYGITNFLRHIKAQAMALEDEEAKPVSQSKGEANEEDPCLNFK